MPRYNYNCVACGEVVTIFHTVDETHTDCTQCNITGSMERMLSKPYIAKQQANNRQSKVGEITKKYIEENRELLKNEKEKLKKKTYEPA